jgi:hypothetical protein
MIIYYDINLNTLKRKKTKVNKLYMLTYGVKTVERIHLYISPPGYGRSGEI